MGCSREITDKPRTPHRSLGHNVVRKLQQKWFSLSEFPWEFSQFEYCHLNFGQSFGMLTTAVYTRNPVLDVTLEMLIFSFMDLIFREL